MYFYYNLYIIFEYLRYYCYKNIIFLFGYIFIYINSKYILQCGKYFFKSLLFKYDLLKNISVIDNLFYKKRFTIFYNIFSYFYNITLFLCLKIKITTKYPYSKGIVSLISLYKNANWLEREIWDLFGIYFYNHSDFRRILTDYGFLGFPLRKEFPLMGYIEIRYDDFMKIIIKEILSITQNYRLYEYTNTFI